MLIQQSPHLLLVSCADYIGLLKLAHDSPEEEMLATHDAPLCGALYNTFFHQVSTSDNFIDHRFLVGLGLNQKIWIRMQNLNPFMCLHVRYSFGPL